MIKINLATDRKSKGGLGGGLDVSKIDKRGMKIAGALVVLAVAASFFFDSNVSDIREQIRQLTVQKTTYDQKVAQSKDIKKQIEEFEQKRSKLQERLNAVKEIVQDKRNPRDILHYIAKNMPPKIWMVKLTLENNILEINGYAGVDDISAITSFKNKLESAAFFDGQMNLEGPNTVRLEKPFVRRVQQFKMTAKVARYE